MIYIDFIRKKVYTIEVIPIIKATIDHFVNRLSLFLMPYIKPTIEATAIPIGKAKKPNRRKLTSTIIPMAIKIFVRIKIESMLRAQRYKVLLGNNSDNAFILLNTCIY